MFIIVSNDTSSLVLHQLKPGFLVSAIVHVGVSVCKVKA